MFSIWLNRLSYRCDILMALKIASRFYILGPVRRLTLTSVLGNIQVENFAAALFHDLFSSHNCISVQRLAESNNSHVSFLISKICRLRSINKFVQKARKSFIKLQSLLSCENMHLYVIVRTKIHSNVHLS